ncbi:MAG: hypothetical protein ABIG61_07365 [Planctomycetota bacterium]
MSKEEKPIDIMEGSVTKDFRVTFIREVLGAQSSDLGASDTYISSKAPTAELSQEEHEAAERAIAATSDEELQKGATLFHRNADNQPILYDYQFEGFLKAAAGALSRKVATVPGHELQLPAYKKVTDQEVFVYPREIVMVLPPGGKIDFFTRPLRADTPKGPRIALATSERIPAGTIFDISVMCLADKIKVKSVSKSLMRLVVAWMSYGRLNGLGQWRNAGYGRFTFEELPNTQQ